MENIRKELEKYEGKTGRPNVRQAILWVFKDDPDGEYTVKGMTKTLDERYAFKVSKPATASARMMELTRDGILIRRPAKSETGREVYHYRVRKPGE